MAHLIWPGAQHSRLEHSVGAMRAASLMFERLKPETPHQDEAALAELIALAALLHDCGHVAFSHVGERVLASLFEGEFRACQAVLQKHFPDPVILTKDGPSAEQDGAALGSKPIPAAELMSALIVISPIMVEQIEQLRVRFAKEEAALFVCGLIISRPTTVYRMATATIVI